MRIIPPVRQQDAYGAGHFGASRDGGRGTHNGADLAMYPGSAVLSHTPGRITKIGFSYAKGVGAWDSSDPYRYVEVTDPAGKRWQYHYVAPAVSQGEMIAAGAVLGHSQALAPRYEGITEHVHLAVIRDGEYLDPMKVMA